ncbi:MAG: DUF1428 domain-containing protein [Pseudomonadota bacterium]
MTYVDGFLCAVPTANKDAYRQHAVDAGVFFKRHGALSVVEGWGDDVPEGELNSMHTAVMRNDDETVVFSWIIWPDKATRYAAMPKVLEEMEAAGFRDMPLDGKRMIFGGFETLVEV